jgi:hypothetical protein
MFGVYLTMTGSNEKGTEEQVMKKHNCTSNKKVGALISSGRDNNFQPVTSPDVRS